MDSDSGYKPFSNARPTVHSQGANLILLDGHIERLPFKTLWALDSSGKAAHPYWVNGTYLSSFSLWKCPKSGMILAGKRLM